MKNNHRLAKRKLQKSIEVQKFVSRFTNHNEIVAIFLRLLFFVIMFPLFFLECIQESIAKKIELLHCYVVVHLVTSSVFCLAEFYTSETQ